MKLPIKTPAKDAAAHWFFKPIERPGFTDAIVFPEDITRLAPSDVGRLHAQYTGLYAYAVAEAAKADVEALRCRSACMMRKNNISRSGSTYGHNKYKVDMQVRLDRTMEGLELDAHAAEEKQIILKSYVEIFDRYAQALSREMTRRTAEFQKA